jgi:hypothetical protein
MNTASSSSSHPSIRFHGLTPNISLRRSIPLIGVVRSIDRIHPDITVVNILDVAVSPFPTARQGCGISEITHITTSEEGTVDQPARHVIQVRLSGAFKKLPIKVDDILSIFGRDVQIIPIDSSLLLRGDHPFAIVVSSFSFGDVVCQVLPVQHQSGQPLYHGNWIEYTSDSSTMNLISNIIISQTFSSFLGTTTTTSHKNKKSITTSTSSSSGGGGGETNNDENSSSSLSKRTRLAEKGYAMLNTLSPGSADVYGIVIGFSSPKQTSTLDYRVEYSIVDESVDMDKPIQVTLFRSRIESLPDVKILGDVMRIHRANVEIFNSRTSLSVGKLKSTVVVTNGNVGDLTPGRFAKNDKTESKSELDFDRVEELRQYALDHIWIENGPWLGQFYTSLGEIVSWFNTNPGASDKYVDTLVKIVELKRIFGELPRIITVCDGSVVPGTSEEIKFDISFWRQEDWDQVQNYYVGDSMIGTWVRIRNFVALKNSSNQFELKFNESKSICGFMRIPTFFKIPDEMRSKRLIRGAINHQNNSNSNSDNGNSSSSSATTNNNTSSTSTGLIHVQNLKNIWNSNEISTRIMISMVLPQYVNVPSFTVSQIINGETNKIVAPWRCTVQYLNHIPVDVNECIVTSSELFGLGKSNSPQCRFMMELCDHSGSISVMFVGREGNQFFRFDEFMGVLDEESAARERLTSAFTLLQRTDCFLDVLLYPVNINEGVFDVRNTVLRVIGLDPQVVGQE